MIPKKTDIINLLQDSKQANPERNTGWVEHSLAVGNVAGKLAEALNKAGQHYDMEKMAILGYLHDIGKMVGDFALHPVAGYEYLKDHGYDEDYCKVCLTHSFVNNDPFCMFSEFMQDERDKFLIEFIQKHQFTDEEKLITLSDCMTLFEPMTVDKRMIDIIARHGVCSKTSERIKATYALKDYFDKQLRYNLYNVFPEIKENL